LKDVTSFINLLNDNGNDNAAHWFNGNIWQLSLIIHTNNGLDNINMRYGLNLTSCVVLLIEQDNDNDNDAEVSFNRCLNGQQQLINVHGSW
jgi:hypothetical protein